MRKPIILLGLCAMIFVGTSGLALADDADSARRAASRKVLEDRVIVRGRDAMRRDIEAAKHSSGDIDQATRTVLGMSARDIRKHGLLGVPGSQLRQLFGSLGLPH
jgi:hypothetical protein